ncbi:peptide chain release factor N(5)-glutamine methyltransferase [Bacteroides acidifaciens]|uniref:peptide chain release factor N(5)-glutamine methyltransferase n=1 Tax=Bacteroides acidifaciens TaxID=85831 RepID=UPI00046AF63E|nr:peptide chain release factor N(5)-glutamine methyltransferase [Bacteroides acidifaciens]MCR1999699.1 peptide chain release factor N(5)-glutamine methyltransferase [Bacteroides acidifaciens]
MNRITTYIRQSLQEIYPPEEVKALSMLICCDMLGLDALDIYMGKDIILSECKQRELENIIFRLQKNEPIQYIRGFAEFDGRRFKVAPGVLIPRPETVELVELVARENTDACRLLDIGTGSGCIAISLDKRLPDAKVEAWDISEEALAVAYTNNKELKAEVMFLQRDVLSDDWEKTPSFDVIVSNPPYVTEAEKNGMDANVLDWEPELALFVPDDDPLRFYRRIADLGRELLLPEGRLYFEINQAYGLETAHMLEMNQYRDVRVIKDIFGKDRIVTANR